MTLFHISYIEIMNSTAFIFYILIGSRSWSRKSRDQDLFPETETKTKTLSQGLETKAKTFTQGLETKTKTLANQTRVDLETETLASRSQD